MSTTYGTYRIYPPYADMADIEHIMICYIMEVVIEVVIEVVMQRLLAGWLVGWLVGWWASSI